MIKRKISGSLIQVILLLFLSNNIIDGQVNNETMQESGTDSLSLKQIIDKVISGYPTVKVAQEAINNADAKIGLARTGYNPDVSASAAYSNIGPVVQLAIPNLGTFQLYPQNNYSAEIDYRQVLYDFGRTRQNISLETEGKAITEQALEQVKQNLSLYCVNNFYNLVFLQEAIRIKNEQIATLNEHLVQVEKKMATGSATEFEILSTRVKISAIESQEIDLKANLTAQRVALNSLLGDDYSKIPVVRTELTDVSPVVHSDSALSYALHNRNEILMNEKRATLAALRYDWTRTQNKPSLSFIASGGAKNGYIPDLNKITPNYVVGLGLKIPIYDAGRTRQNILQAQSAITSISYESEDTKRHVTNEIYSAEAYMAAAGKKINQFELQLKQAQRAYQLAEINYKAGTITNLDLLDVYTSLSETRLMLLKARIDYVASVYKLKAAIGEKLY
jgi:outer membrane protein